MTVPKKQRSWRCKLGLHLYETWIDHNDKLHRGCPKCGKVQHWIDCGLASGWCDWAKGWTYRKAVAMSRAYERGASIKERKRILRDIE